MANKIKINCKKVYDTAVFYGDSAQRISELKKELSTISSNVSNAWQGVDNNNFTVTFNNHIEQLNELVSFLESKSLLLKKISSLHNSVDNDFSNSMKRVDLNE